MADKLSGSAIQPGTITTVQLSSSVSNTVNNAVLKTGDTMTGELNVANNLVMTGNLTFSGTAQRITGDFSNATVANRLAFQTSTTNGQTAIGALPNGTGTTGVFRSFGNSDPTNANAISIAQLGTTEGRLSTEAFGTASALPMTFYTGGSERVRIDANGNVGIGGTALGYEKVVAKGTHPSSSGATRIFTADGVCPSATTSNFYSYISQTGAENASFTLSNYYHFGAVQGTFGASATITNQYGFSVNSNLTGGTNNYGFYSNIASGSNRWNFYAAGTARNYFAGGVEDANGNLRKIPKSGSAKTTSYSLQTSDVGLFVEVGSGGSITVPNATFAEGDVVSIFNNTSGDITLTMSITNAYIGGTNSNKATITLATRGVATILFISGTVCVVNGNVS
jgi:hypothetical protein